MPDERPSADQVADFDMILENCAGEISRLGENLETFKKLAADGLEQVPQRQELNAAIIEASREIRRHIELIQSKLPFDPSPRA